MTLIDIGQPVGTVMQYAYVVEDIPTAIREYSALFSAGPWFVTPSFNSPSARYRGQPTTLEMTLAMGYSGHVMIELIQQHNDVPSVYMESVAKRGYGFHHFAIHTTNFDADIARYQSRGFEVVFTDTMPEERTPFRVAYLDTTAVLPGMLELLELIPAVEEQNARMYRASVDWDGKDPIRPYVAG